MISLPRERMDQLVKRFDMLEAQLLHLVGRIHGAVDDDVDDVNSLRRELCVEGLAEHSTTSHGRRMRVLSAVPTHCRRR